ncbi:MAG: dTDP-4-amino-4,6-dideoxygalactose transaminase [bacterium]|nr:dTDP-4-amino-4,6-dideoxygalactose transaminase [Candidatus Colisoma equi]
MIHFNKPHMTGMETEYIRQAVEGGKISGNGEFTKRCQAFFERRYGFKKCLLTTSGTDALEMAAILTGVGPGDEVIVPSYTFVSTALAFLRCGAKVVFADSRADEPNIDATKIEALITSRTKVIVPVHYAGCACDMDAIMEIANRHNLLVVEDAAQAVDSWYIQSTDLHGFTRINKKGGQNPCESEKSVDKKPLGGIGHLGCFSFHETKNIIAGEGGLLTINDERFVRRAEIIWEKGTNRAEFFRGEVNKYGWVDIGSSFLPTEIVSAFLWAQLEHLDEIQAERKRLWQNYWDFLTGIGLSTDCTDLHGWGGIRLPKIPGYATNNAHMFYLLFPDLAKRSDFIAKMKARDILTVFHYLPLHSSAYYAKQHDGRTLPNCDRYADTLVRLPLYYGLGPDQDKVFAAIKEALV